jgi:hypothetical protein
VKIVTVMTQESGSDGERIYVQINDPDQIRSGAPGANDWHTVPSGIPIPAALRQVYGADAQIHASPESLNEWLETNKNRLLGIASGVDAARRSVIRLEVEGFRGFRGRSSVDLALPDGEQAGSGLTILVGANGGGKSVILEALFLLSKIGGTHELIGEVRNRGAFSHVRAGYRLASGQEAEFVTTEEGGTTMEWRFLKGDPFPQGDVYGVPSRRPPSEVQIGAATLARQEYQRSFDGNLRSGGLQNFGGRLRTAHKTRSRFDPVVAEIAGTALQWRLDPVPQVVGSAFPSFGSGAGDAHRADGLGDGTWRAMQIADAIYDAPDGCLLLIDEPELSMYPAAQRRLARLLARAAKSRQIVIATHSPAFIEWEWLQAGARLARVYRRDGHSHVANLPPERVDELSGLIGSRGHIHVLGSDAKEVFFHDDPLILVEGPEDAWGYRRIAQELNAEIPGTILGWGTGGAAQMGSICRLLKSLNYRSVVGVLDRNEAETAKRLSAEFPDYRFVVSPLDDVRTKPASKSRETAAVLGFLEDGRLLDSNREAARKLFDDISRAISG